MSDEVIKCLDCSMEFTFSESEAAFYASKSLTKPKRCKPCRDKRKAAKATESGTSAGPVPVSTSKRTQWVGGGEEEPRRGKSRDRRRGSGHEF